MNDPQRLLREQVEYYRARAPEYDDWFERRGIFDQGPEWNARWFAEAGEVAAALERLAPYGRVLELACGTGWWTQALVRHASELTAVDAAPEAVERNRRRVGDERVRYVTADLFDWEPEARYDLVFFGFWLSHVPPERFAEFWELVRRALGPGGRVFFVDSARADVPGAERIRTRVQPTEHPDGTVVRLLNDGRGFRIVKLYYDPAELEARLEGMGWSIRVARTERFFLYGTGARGGEAGSRGA